MSARKRHNVKWLVMPLSIVHTKPCNIIGVCDTEECSDLHKQHTGCVCVCLMISHVITDCIRVHKPRA